MHRNIDLAGAQTLFLPDLVCGFIVLTYDRLDRNVSFPVPWSNIWDHFFSRVQDELKQFHPDLKEMHPWRVREFFDRLQPDKRSIVGNRMVPTEQMFYLDFPAELHEPMLNIARQIPKMLVRIAVQSRT